MLWWADKIYPTNSREEKEINVKSTITFEERKKK